MLQILATQFNLPQTKRINHFVGNFEDYKMRTYRQFLVLCIAISTVSVISANARSAADGNLNPAYKLIALQSPYKWIKIDSKDDFFSPD